MLLPEECWKTPYKYYGGFINMKTVILLFALVQPLFAAGQSTCIGDTNDDDIIDVNDVLSVLTVYGASADSSSVMSDLIDTNDDDIIDVHDVLSVLAVYGASADSSSGRACIHKGNYQCSELKPLFRETQCSCPFESDTRCTAIRSAFDICGCADSQPQFASGDSVSVLPKFTTKRNCKDIKLKYVISETQSGELGTTYQLYLELGSEQENVYAIYGTKDHPMSFPASYQVAAPYGNNVGEVSSIFFAISAESEFDGWLAVGPTSGEVSVGIDFDGWTASSGLSVANGAVIWMNPDEGPSDKAVLVAQITVADGSSFTVALNAQGRSNDGDDWYCEGLDILITS